MNKDRRNALAEVESTIDEAIGQIQDVIDEEADALDGLPESLQDSDRAMAMNDAIEDMESLIGVLDDFTQKLLDVVKKHTPKKKK